MLLKGLCPSHSVALSALINKRCTLADVRAGREPSIYIQSIVVTNAKDAKFDTAFQQLTWAWRNLDPVLKRILSSPMRTQHLLHSLRKWSRRRKYGRRSINLEVKHSLIKTIMAKWTGETLVSCPHPAPKAITHIK